MYSIATPRLDSEALLVGEGVTLTASGLLSGEPGAAVTKDDRAYPIDNAERHRDARNKFKEKQKAAGMTNAEIKAAKR